MGRMGTYQIGEAAERVGLSLRTVRYYEEVGLVTPTDRTSGGFRLYTDADIERLVLAKDLKPLGFSLEQMRELLDVFGRVRSKGTRAAKRDVRRLEEFVAQAESRCADLEAQLEAARDAAAKVTRTLRAGVSG